MLLCNHRFCLPTRGREQWECSRSMSSMREYNEKRGSGMSAISKSASAFGSRVPRVLLLSGMFLCFVLSAQSQESGQGPRAPILLPDGPGKAVVQTACVVCHDLERVTRPTGATKQEWQNTVDYMVS